MSPTGHNRLDKFDILWSRTCFNLYGWALLLALDQTVMYSYIFTYYTSHGYIIAVCFFMEIASVFAQFTVPRRQKLKTEKIYT